jgi:hypothetical protein
MGSGQQVLVRASPLPGLEVTVRYALYVPAATPPEIVHKLNADTVAVLAEPGIRGKMEQIGVAVVGSTPKSSLGTSEPRPSCGVRSSRRRTSGANDRHSAGAPTSVIPGRLTSANPESRPAVQFGNAV